MRSARSILIERQGRGEVAFFENANVSGSRWAGRWGATMATGLPGLVMTTARPLFATSSSTERHVALNRPAGKLADEHLLWISNAMRSPRTPSALDPSPLPG